MDASSSAAPAPAPAPPATPPIAKPVPMVRSPRTLVLCFDGTANEYDSTNTNVVKLFSLLKKDNIDAQLCYYQAGVGTYFQPGTVSPVFSWVAKVADEAVAWYLPAHVMDGYKFLMQNYNAGDKVCLFAGFSRGAYTARALAGMLHKVGLLPRDNFAQVPFAYKLYKSSKASNQVLAAGFKQTFSRDVPIEFLGVWDTVASVGIVWTRSLPFVTTNTTIRTFRHALSLDEHRAKFRPDMYNRPVPDTSPAKADRNPVGVNHLVSNIKSGYRKVKRSLDETHRSVDKAIDEILDVSDGDDRFSTSSKEFTTDVREVWFSGCHSDVGGGSVSDTTEYSLADVPLCWMVREVMQVQCGILFEDAALHRWRIPLTATDSFKGKPGGTHKKQTSLHDYMKPGHNGKSQLTDGNGKEAEQPDNPLSKEQSREEQDVVQPINDELKIDPLWWLLEIVPTKYAWQNSAGEWVSKWSFHLGRGRFVPANPKFHHSVKLRMEDPNLKYTPKAKYVKGTETYVD
ncbi:hypothetical protein EWM64_g7930 [Hericium alpestre]|uniref:T6SS Phospholipase effector Tle1-like catalytic domain-containing protein n=1 Tax=Hericium alpestre TaxID=135208 RepID=A0A4Y9ZMQ9_9AGAM|nr:hypothetical protein EWM64_g7930 [Hericium alpestre]